MGRESLAALNAVNNSIRGFNESQNYYDNRDNQAMKREQHDAAMQQSGLSAQVAQQNLQINKMEISNQKRAQLAQQAMQEWRLAETGSKEYDPALHEALVENGMAAYSPLSYMDDSFSQKWLKLRPVMAEVNKGNIAAARSPEVMKLLSDAYSDQVKKGVGERHPVLGKKIVDKEIVGLKPAPDQQYIGVVVRSTLEDGSSYDDMMTMGRGTDPGDPVRMVKLRDLLGDINSSINLATVMSRPDKRDRFKSAYDVIYPSAESKPSSTIGKLIADRDALLKKDPESPEIAHFNSAIKKAATGTKGIRVLPDGTVEVGGSGEEIMPLDKPNARKSQEKLISSIESLKRMDKIYSDYKPEFLTFQGRLKNGFSALKDKAGVDLSDDERTALRQYRRFSQNVDTEFNAYRKLITGAAAAVAELESLKKAMISTDLSPEQFESAWETYRSELAYTVRIHNRLLRQGLEPGTEQFGEALDQMYVAGEDDSHTARGEELERQGLGDDEIVSTLQEEGYL